MAQDVTIKVGIFGGAFDPPHKEHVRLAQAAIEELSLDLLVIVPSYHAPHKLTSTSFDDRVEMCKLAFASIPQVVVDPIEQEVDGATYSAVVLPKLVAKYGEIVHLIGGDSLLAIESWYHPEEVLRYPTAVFARDNLAECRLKAARLADKYGARITVLRSVGEAVSSTEIRYALAVGRSSPTLSQEVSEYVKSKGLYAPYAKIVEGVSAHLSPKRWAHTQEVALFAAALAPMVGVSVDKALLAGLLHDCAKTALDGAEYEYLCNKVPADCRQRPVLHSFVGALVAKEVYGVEDEEILGAVRYHTTGRADMTPIEKLIYLADYAEPTRTHPGSSEVRELAHSDFEAAFRLAVLNTYTHVADSPDLCPKGKECYRFYFKQGEHHDQ